MIQALAFYMFALTAVVIVGGVVVAFDLQSTGGM